jgi:hypothetical protein
MSGIIDRKACGRGHEVGSGRAQPDHHDPRRHGVEPAPEDVLSLVPLLGTKFSVDDGGACGGVTPAWVPVTWYVP